MFDLGKYQTEEDTAELLKIVAEKGEIISRQKALAAARLERDPLPDPDAQPELSLGDTPDETALARRLAELEAQSDAIENRTRRRYIADLRRGVNPDARLLEDCRHFLRGLSRADVATGGLTYAPPSVRAAVGDAIAPDVSETYTRLYHFCDIFTHAADALALSRYPLEQAIADRARELGAPLRLSRLPVGPVTEPLYWLNAKGATATGEFWKGAHLFKGLRITPPSNKGAARAVLYVENPRGVNLAKFGVRAASMFRFALSRALTAADFRTAALANWSITFAELADLWGLPATPDGLKDAREFALAAAAELAGAYATLPPKRKGDAHGGLFPYLRRAVPTKDGGIEIGFNPDFLAALSGGQWTLTDARAVGKLGEQKRGAYAIAAAMERAYYMDAKRVTGANGRLRVDYLLDVGGYKTRDELGTHRNAWRDRVKGRLERDLDTLTEQPRALLKRWWYCRPNETLPLTAEAVAGLAWGGWYALCVAYEMDAPLPLAERDRIEAAKQKRDAAKANAKKARASKAQKRIAKAKAKAAPPTPPEFAQRPIGAPTPSPQARPTATDAPPLEEEQRYLSAKEMRAGLAQVRAHLIEAGLVPRRAPAPEPTTPLEEKYKGIEEARRRLAELPDKIARYRGLMADATDPKQRDAYAVQIAAWERLQAEAQATIDAL